MFYITNSRGKSFLVELYYSIQQGIYPPSLVDYRSNTSLHREGEGRVCCYNFLGSVTTPVIAEAATTRGLARMVRAPGP